MMMTNEIHRMTDYKSITSDRNNPTACPLSDACFDNWTWNILDKSPDIVLSGDRHQIVHFHPNWSNGTAGVRANRPLKRDDGKQYWEIQVTKRLFGTSMMFGVCSAESRMHVDAFTNMLGADRDSWGLSHKGFLYHGGRFKEFTEPFRENQTTVVGMLYDARQGTLTYYRDGENLGVAVQGLNQVNFDLYPAVCSTAAKTEMILLKTVRNFRNLEDRCRDAIVSRIKNLNDYDRLPLPYRIKEYVKQSRQFVAAKPTNCSLEQKKVELPGRYSFFNNDMPCFRKRVLETLMPGHQTRLTGMIARTSTVREPNSTS